MSVRPVPIFNLRTYATSPLGLLVVLVRACELPDRHEAIRPRVAAKGGRAIITQAALVRRQGQSESKRIAKTTHEGEVRSLIVYIIDPGPNDIGVSIAWHCHQFAAGLRAWQDKLKALGTAS